MNPEKRIQMMCDLMELSDAQAEGLASGLIIGIAAAHAHPESAKRFLDWALSTRADGKQLADQSAVIVPFIIDGVAGVAAAVKS